MAVTITIAGADRTADVKMEGLQIQQVLTYAEDNCNFTAKSGSKPSTGAEIIVDDSGTKLFAGIIDDVKEEYVAGSVVFYSCTARDYTYLIDRRLVVENYSSQAAEDILLDIVSRYITGFTTVNVQTGAPTVESTGTEMNYKRPSECFKWLCDYIGWQWYCDYDKDIWFFNPSDLSQSAPIRLEAGNNFRNLRHDIETVGLRNRVFVRGGTILSDTFTYEIKADGTTRTWNLPHKPHSLTMTVGAVAKTIGVENVDDEAGYDYMMNYQEKYVRASTGTGTPADGTTMSFSYKYDADIISMMEDGASQTAIAAIQGGDGIYEHVIVDTSLATNEAAEAAAEADLREHGNPKVRGGFDTTTGGWVTGQLLDIDLPAEGITGTYVVQKITITPISPTTWNYHIEYGGRLIAIEDFLSALVSAQQKKDLNSTEVLHKFALQSETADVTDEIEDTPRYLPYFCGDADAICGFVQLDGGWFVGPGMASGIGYRK